jgi:hypothetical protein
MAKDPKTNPHPLAPTSAAMNTVPVGPARTTKPQKGMSVPKKGAVMSQDAWPTARPRQIMERMGARRRIEVNLPGPNAPEAAATQANGRIVPSVMGQSRNFAGGQDTHN